MCDAQRMGGAVCRPLTAVAVAIERNRSVNDPASRLASCPRGSPRVVHATVPGDQFFMQIIGESSGQIARKCIVFASARRCGFPPGNQAPDSAECGYAGNSVDTRESISPVEAIVHHVAPQRPSRKRAGCVKAATAASAASEALDAAKRFRMMRDRSDAMPAADTNYVRGWLDRTQPLVRL